MRQELNEYLQLDISEGTSKFVNTLSKLTSWSSRQDLLKNQKRKIIANTAQLLNCQFAMLSDTTNSLATTLLSAIALGRGGAAALDAALQDNRLANGELTLIRPLRDLNEAEIQLYVRAQLLQPFKHSDYGQDAGCSTSLQNLTKAFVDNLQVNYPSTVSTVFRTGDKIAPKLNAKRDNAIENDLQQLSVSDNVVVAIKCKVCSNTLDASSSMTLQAIEFSQKVSELASKLNEKCNLAEIEQKQLINGRSASNSGICHACSNILRDCSLKDIQSFILE